MNPDRFRELQQMFHSALERAPEDREAFVMESAGSDVELRKELMSLINAHETEDAFLETSLTDTEAPLLEGQSVGPYRVLGELGRGGMGVVYLAEDSRLKRRVALKALSPALVRDPKQQERFRREAMVAGSLSHPAIATIYAMEEVEGRFYMVSEYVPGHPLRVEATAAPMAPDAVRHVGLQIARGLAAAHEKGVVHRDLKPENVLRIDDEHLKIVDFGLAISPVADSAEARLTQTGTLVGTPAYMSPEQLLGEPVDVRSDLFSLGIVLYELLLGQHPFESETLIGTSARILESPPSGFGRLQSRDPGLGRIILRCLEKSPSARFASAQEVVAELEALSKGSGDSRWSAVLNGGPESELRSDWWVVHQAAVIALYTVMIVLCFAVSARFQLPVLLWSAFLVLACGIWNGAMRAHLLFTLRFNHRALRRELTRTARLMWPIDVAFSLLLVAVALAVLPVSQPWAVAMASVGICYSVVVFIVEPNTVRSVFPTEPD